MARFWRRLGILALAAGALTWGAGLLRDSKALEENLVRLHVVANSDSQEDQDLKLQVRDAIVAQLNGVMEELDSARRPRSFWQNIWGNWRTRLTGCCSRPVPI